MLAHRRFSGSWFACAVMLMVGTLVVAPAAQADSSRPWRASILAARSPAEVSSDAAIRPLSAEYAVHVLGSAARGTLTQTFRNDTDRELVAHYVADRLPGVSVELLEARTGGQTHDDLLRGVEAVRRDVEARRARTRGDEARATLRSAGFPVAAGETVEVRVEFSLELTFEEGVFQLRLPTVLSRASSGKRERQASVGQAVIPTRATVTVHRDLPLLRVSSSTHEVYEGFSGDRTTIELGGSGQLGAQDLLLEWALGEQERTSLVGLVGAERDGAHEVMLILSPPIRARTEEVRPKQVLFVLDTSGSMGRGKLDLARESLLACLERLAESDLFNIARFAGTHELLHAESVRAEEAAVAQAAPWLLAQRPQGNTRLVPALEAVLGQEPSPEHHQMIVVLTDGALQDAPAVLSLLGERLGSWRLFVVGIGDDVQEGNVHRIVERGRGSAVFSRHLDEIRPAVAALFDSVSQPLAWDLAVDWGSARVERVEPQRLADLYAGRPVTIRARLRGELPQTVGIRARTMLGEQEFTSNLQRLQGIELPRGGRTPSATSPRR